MAGLEYSIKLILILIFNIVSKSDSLIVVSNTCYQTAIDLPINVEETTLIQNFTIKNISYPFIASPVINQEVVVVDVNEKSLNYTSFYVPMNSTGRVVINDHGVDETYNPLKILINIPSDHSIQNHKADIEMQVVHQEIKNPNKMLVISVLIIINESSSSIFSSFKVFSSNENVIGKLANDPNSKIKFSNLSLIKEITQLFSNSLNMSRNIITPRQMYYYYKTNITPAEIFQNNACNKEIKYLVMNNFRSVKRYQYDYLKNLYFEKNRNFYKNYNNTEKTKQLIPIVYLYYNSSITLNSDYLSLSSFIFNSSSITIMIALIILI